MNQQPFEFAPPSRALPGGDSANSNANNGTAKRPGTLPPPPETWPCFPLPKACDRVKPSFCPKPKKKGVQKIMPTDDSVFAIAAADGMSLPVAVENLNGPLQVEASGKLDVCLAAQAAPLVVNIQDDVNVSISEPLAIINAGKDAFLVDAVVAGEVRVANVGTEALNVKIGWNKECDDAVPVYGQFEVCNCGDKPLQVELAGVGTEGLLVNAVVMGEMAVTNVGTESLCVALTNKEKPVCIASAPTSLGGQTGKRGGQCLFNSATPADARNCYYQGGLYPLVAAAPNETVSVNQIRSRVTANNTIFGEDNLLLATSLGQLVIFPYYATADLNNDNIINVTNSNDWYTYINEAPTTFAGQTAVNCDLLDLSDVNTEQWTVNLSESYGGPVNLANPNDTLLAKFELPNPSNESTVNAAFGNNIFRYEVDAFVVRQPASCPAPPLPQPVPPNEFPIDIKFYYDKSFRLNRIQFTSVDCSRQVLNGPRGYSATLFQLIGGAFMPLETINVNQGMAGEPYFGNFNAIVVSGDQYAFCIDKNATTLFESTPFEYVIRA